ncbi:NADH oxidase [Weissella viridescens]|uniref:NADH oxidase n=1 Tax=Weissella viridescens TaxID=1629 RepID=A0A380NZ59_WEIVI|nr:NADH oxidase [Weissella viridescens]
MQTSLPDVYAAGDASAVFYNPTQAYDYIPLATNAVRQGMLIGRNISQPKVAYPGTQATSAVELYETAIGTTGLTSVANAEAKGISADAVTIEEDYRPDFMLSTERVVASLVWEKETRRIIGAEFLSAHDVTQAANVVSVAIENQMTIDQLALSDFFSNQTLVSQLIIFHLWPWPQLQKLNELKIKEGKQMPSFFVIFCQKSCLHKQNQSSRDLYQHD